MERARFNRAIASIGCVLSQRFLCCTHLCSPRAPMAFSASVVIFGVFF